MTTMHAGMAWPWGPPRSLARVKLGVEASMPKGPRGSETSTGARPGPPPASHRRRPVLSFCRTPCWRPRHRAVSLSLAAGDTRVRPRRGTVPQTRSTPPLSTNPLLPPTVNRLAAPCPPCTRRSDINWHRPPPLKPPRHRAPHSPPDHLPGGEELSSSLLAAPLLAVLQAGEGTPVDAAVTSSGSGAVDVNHSDPRCFRRHHHRSIAPAPLPRTRPNPPSTEPRDSNTAGNEGGGDFGGIEEEDQGHFADQGKPPLDASLILYILLLQLLQMPIEYSHFHQVGVRPPLYFFERALADLAFRCGRPAPEVKGVRTERPEDSEMAWLVTCVVRGGEVAPVSEEFTVDVMERTWLDGMIRVFQEALARLALLHPEAIADTGYQYLGLRNGAGQPVAGAPHPDTAHQLHHLEYLLHHTQVQQDRARERCDLQDDEIVTLRAQLAAAQADLASERKKRLAARRRASRLKAKVASLEALTAQMETTIEELEDDGEDLRKENEALLSDDDDYEEEDFDMEPDTEDEAFINNEDEEPEPLMPEEDPEEDPEEPPFDEGAPPAPEGPVVDLDDF
ncbi:hypothetical protein QYE76_064373 [Lolium multiflorum]|uniref:Uncharacterized protein n=1 Tax=Lolium multiflorum TaxID=4521 RepID=A0AAD8S7J5_LOLMU|nr:hypothetical protein QYE76_064373 [Lolium multiflorum]